MSCRAAGAPGTSFIVVSNCGNKGLYMLAPTREMADALVDRMAADLRT
jgi:hypothetical protein